MPLCDCLFFAERTEDGVGPFVLISAEAVDNEDASYFDETPALPSGGLVKVTEQLDEPVKLDPAADPAS